MNDAQKVAQRILNILGKFDLDMSNYSSRPPNMENCGTTFCLLGYLAYEDNYPHKYWAGRNTFDYQHYSEAHLGIHVDVPMWDYLFGIDNPNDFESAKERAEYVLEHGTC